MILNRGALPAGNAHAFSKAKVNLRPGETGWLCNRAQSLCLIIVKNKEIVPYLIHEIALFSSVAALLLKLWKSKIVKVYI